MKHIVVLILAILTSISAFGQGDKELVLKILGDQQKRWNKADIDCFMEGYWKSDSLMFIGRKGIVFGWQATLERYKKSYPGKEAMGELEFDIKETKRIADDAYFVVGMFHLTRTIGDLEGYFTLVFKKINGKWVVVSDHTG